MLVLYHHQEGEKGCWYYIITRWVRKIVGTLPHRVNENEVNDIPVEEGELISIENNYVPKNGFDFNVVGDYSKGNLEDECPHQTQGPQDQTVIWNQLKIG
ncbi:hypothetical protein MA16_Dca007743 [Dendrobium catenatum]|uniref:Uncharacterized protein n=1 Tax=Dendrobium catenatum TaxID=906689 RepID=A0A2I0X595_9ASPA|nr:hypothetical protein MA16_Dca007743 [Dendrobium catenatum]